MQSASLKVPPFYGGHSPRVTPSRPQRHHAHLSGHARQGEAPEAAHHRDNRRISLEALSAMPVADEGLLPFQGLCQFTSVAE
jgi:hypothetical protein